MGSGHGSWLRDAAFRCTATSRFASRVYAAQAFRVYTAQAFTRFASTRPRRHFLSNRGAKYNCYLCGTSYTERLHEVQTRIGVLSTLAHDAALSSLRQTALE